MPSDQGTDPGVVDTGRGSDQGCRVEVVDSGRCIGPMTHPDSLGELLGRRPQGIGPTVYCVRCRTAKPESDYYPSDLATGIRRCKECRVTAERERRTVAVITHPRYPVWQLPNGQYTSPGPAHIGNVVAHRDDHTTPIGIVTAVYLDAVELSTGDQVPVADLVLLKRADL